MDELTRRARAIGAALEADLAPEDIEASLAGCRKRQSRRRLIRAGAAGLLAVAAVVALLLRAWPSSDHGPGGLRLADGTLIVPAAGGEVVPLAIDPSSTVIELERGAAEFIVPHVEGRRFTVRAGAIAVHVVGTRFTVRREPDAVVVAVTTGRVVVDAAGAETPVSEGETRRFLEAIAAAPVLPAPPAAPAPAPRPASAVPPPPSSERHAAAPAHPREKPVEAAHVEPAPPPTDWRSLAHDGNFNDAYGRMVKSPTPASSVDELLLAADVARLSGHPAEAVPPLRRILAEHPGDPRIAITAFTLGRVLLDDLGKPTEAAGAFAQARGAAPDGPLAEDALAREVEAWSRAGDADRAAALARRYLMRYPAGHRLRAVKQFGGLQ